MYHLVNRLTPLVRIIFDSWILDIVAVTFTLYQGGVNIPGAMPAASYDRSTHRMKAIESSWHRMKLYPEFLLKNAVHIRS